MRIRAQFAIQLIGGILNSLVLLALTPFLVRTLGLDRYGVLLLILGFALYAGLAEFGLGMATACYVSKANDQAERTRILGASLLVSAPLAVIAGTLFSCLSLPTLGVKFGLHGSSVAELENARMALFLFGTSIVVCSVFNGLLYGLQRFVAMNLINTLSSALFILGPTVCAILFGNQIWRLVLTIALGQWIIILVYVGLCFRGKLYPTFRNVDSKLLKALLMYGAWSTFGGLLHRMTNSIDRPFIAGLVGTAAIPIFAVPQSIISRSNVIVGALAGAVIPRFAKTEGTSAHSRLLDACYRSTCALGPVYVIAILALHPFLDIWLGSNFAKSALNTAVVLAVASWVDAIGTVPYAALLATDSIRKEGKLAAVILIPNAGALWFSLLTFGVLGAAVVAAARSVAYLIGRIFITGFRVAPIFEIFSQSCFVILAGVVAVLFPDRLLSVGLPLAGISAALTLAGRGPIVEEAIQIFAVLKRPR